jgi:large-conductance mechanosensitive channel
LTDPSGNVVTLAIIATAFAMGAVVSLISKYIEDVMFNMLMGKKGFSMFALASSNQQYLSRMITGGICGIIDTVIPYANAGRWINPIMVPFLDQTFEILNKNNPRTGYDGSAYMRDVFIRFGTSFLGCKLPISVNASMAGLLLKIAVKAEGGIFTGLSRALIKYWRLQRA